MDKDLTPEEVEALSKAMGKSASEEATQARVSRAQFLPLEEISEAADFPKADLERVYDVKVKVEAILGRSKLPLDKVLSLHTGSVLELNKLAGEPVDLFANGKLIARAEVVIIDENFGVKILEVIDERSRASIV